VQIRRVVADLTVAHPRQAAEFYRSLGLEVVMDHGWIVTLADPADPTRQLSLMSRDATAPVDPVVSIEVDDVDAAHDATRTVGFTIIHPLTDEEWGVRRFFFADADGNVVNVLGDPRRG